MAAGIGKLKPQATKVAGAIEDPTEPADAFEALEAELATEPDLEAAQHDRDAAEVELADLDEGLDT